MNVLTKITGTTLKSPSIPAQIHVIDLMQIILIYATQSVTKLGFHLQLQVKRK